MKKIYLTAVLISAIAQLTYAQWTTNGSNVYNSNTGNVGIGTSSPGAKLDVNGVINSNSYTSSTLGFYVNTTADGFNNSVGAGYLAFRSNNVDNRMVIDPNGNVGIGTSAPTRNLTLQSPNANSYISWTNAGSEKWVVGSEGTANDRFIIYGGTTPTYQLTILNNGNIGIGTVSPSNRLDIQGGNASVYNTGNATIFGIGSGINGKSILQLSTSADAGGYGSIQAVSAQNSAWGNIVLNSSGGNVLIGKTSQANTGYLLDVNGNARANSVVVNSTGADFVFKPTYHLNSLAWLEKYINLNHHLPEIPSAKEMQANGLNVGDNETKLLQKVEELTLYLIEKDKKEKAQQQEIDLLKQQVQILLNASKIKTK